MTWFMPLVVMLGSYLTIILVIYRRSRIFKNGKNNESQMSSGGLLGNAKVKTIKITGVLVFGFVVSWTPYNAMCVW